MDSRQALVVSLFGGFVLAAGCSKEPEPVQRVPTDPTKRVPPGLPPPEAKKAADKRG